MRNRWLLNLILLVVIAGLALFAIYRPTKDLDSGPALTSLAPDSIKHIAIERAGQPPIVLEQQQRQWRMTSPRPGRANVFKVDQVRRIAAARSENKFEVRPEELGRYGLDRPQLTLRLDDATIVFGVSHPLKPQYYVRIGDTVHLVSIRHFGSVAQADSDFLDTRLLEEEFKPTAFKLPAFALSLVDGVWQRAPALENLATDQVNAFVEEWRQARALSVERHTGKPPPAPLTVTGQMAGDPPKVLKLGIIATSPEFVLYRQDEGLAYHFTEETGKRLLHLEPRADN